MVLTRSAKRDDFGACHQAGYHERISTRRMFVEKIMMYSSLSADFSLQKPMTRGLILVLLESTRVILKNEFSYSKIGGHVLTPKFGRIY